MSDRQYDNNNEIALWRNDKKETESHPDYTGSATVEHVEYWASAWKQERRHERSPVVKIKLTPKNAPAPAAAYPDDSDLPF